MKHVDKGSALSDIGDSYVMMISFGSFNGRKNKNNRINGKKKRMQIYFFC
jgi:hypothetical protein